MGGLTNERPQTDHVITGPMRGLKKIAWEGDKQTDFATTRPTRPRGPSWWKAGTYSTKEIVPPRKTMQIINFWGHNWIPLWNIYRSYGRPTIYVSIHWKFPRVAELRPLPQNMFSRRPTKILFLYSWSCLQDYRAAGRHRKLPIDSATDFLLKLDHTLQQSVVTLTYIPLEDLCQNV